MTLPARVHTSVGDLEMESGVVSWDRKFAALQAWKREHGGEDPPTSATCQGVNLGQWCKTQRRARRESKLLASREKRLEDIGFTWNPGRGMKRKRINDDEEDGTSDGSDSGQEEYEYEVDEENIDGMIVKGFRAV